jgi:protein SCO1/2
MEDSTSSPDAHARRSANHLWLVAAILCIAGAVYLQFSKKADNDRKAVTASSQPSPPILGQVQDFALTERSGRSVTLKNVLGRVWIADFFFASCGATCPIMTDRLRMVREELARQGMDEVLCVSVSVDPARDSPRALTEYAAKHKASPTHWLFLTGDMPAIEKLATKSFNLGKPDPVPGEDQILHSEKFFLIDRTGRIRGAYASITPEEEDDLMRVPAGSDMPAGEKSRLLTDIRLLMRESAR